MRKILWGLSLISLAAFLPALLLASPAPADMAPDLLTATVTLLDMETDRNGFSVLTLMLPDGETKIEVNTQKDCPLYDERENRISRAEFLERYQDKPITIAFVEIDPEGYMIYEARGGNK